MCSPPKRKMLSRRAALWKVSFSFSFSGDIRSRYAVFLSFAANSGRVICWTNLDKKEHRSQEGSCADNHSFRELVLNAMFNTNQCDPGKQLENNGLSDL